MADPKNDQNNPASQQNKGSGSDTVSAAKISAGSSVGTVGQSPPMPQAQGGASNPAQTGASNPAQSATLASHTSKPLGGQSDPDHRTGPAGQGGQAGARDQKPAAGQGGQPQGAQGQGGQGPGGQGRQGMGQGSDSMRRSADQAREGADEAYDEAKEWMRDTYESAAHWAAEKFGSRGSPERYDRGRSRRLGNARRGVQDYVAQNPVMVGLVGLAAGLLLGALLPRTRREDEMFGEWADEVREQGMRYAHDMTQRGREYVESGFSGEDDRFDKHESEFGRGPGAERSGTGVNRH